ncbi:MAG: DUF4386 family protein [Chloroflexota bacterium]
MENSDKQLKLIYKAGAISTIIVLCGIIIDMAAGTLTGGNVAALPQTAVGRFNQFRENELLGLYNLDLLNVINQIILIPSIFALYSIHRETNKPSAALSLILFLVGTTIFIAGNTAMTMLDLSHKYFGANSDEQRMLLSAAGEAMLAKGSHGSLGVFMGFALPTFANVLMSCVMLTGRIFSRSTSYIGIIGNSLMVIYLVLITFIPGVDSMALIFAMPGGILVMIWMIMYTIRLFKISQT